jgi:chromosome transmission fidelity protein 18
MSSYSPGTPSSFDPALLYSEIELQQLQQNAPPSTSFSDDIEALQQCITEDTVKKNSEGVVIQYRAWNLTEIFRSEGEAALGTAASIPRHLLY